MWAYVKKNWIFAVFWFFTAFSGLMTWYFASAIYDVVRARNWTPTSCTVLNSRVVAGYKGRSHIHVEYEYVVNGVVYRSSRYKFLGGQTNFRKSVPIELLAGKVATCYVDPADPSSAVIRRGLTGDMLFGLIPLIIFFFCGLATVGTLCDMFQTLSAWAKGRWNPTGSP